MDLQQALAQLVAGEDLGRDDMAAVMRAVMSGGATRRIPCSVIAYAFPPASRPSSANAGRCASRSYGTPRRSSTVA